MNFDLENPYIEYESDDIPYSLYEIQGVSKIKELSRQLRTFMNYKTATIQYRFSPKNFTCFDREDKIYNETKKNFKTFVFKFLKLLLKIRKTSVSYSVELKQLIEKLILTEDKMIKSFLADLRDITQELFTNIHALSELEIYLHPKLFKFIVKLTQEACIVSQILNNWASEFYEELRINYLQLHVELTLLIPEVKAENNIKKKNFLEKGLEEW